MSRSFQRRELIETLLAGAGGLAAIASGIAPRSVGAAPADPDAGPLATPNPIKGRIDASGVRAALINVVAPERTGTTKPFALLNYLYHANDDSGELYVNDSLGKLWRIHGDPPRATIFLDLRAARGGALRTRTKEMGFRSFAFHPDYDQPGRIGYRKLYTMSTETAASRPAGVDLFPAPSQAPVRSHNVLAEWQRNASNRTVVDVGSRREVLRIEQMYTNHCTDQLLFNPNVEPGNPDYGRLYIGTGDGGKAGDPFEVAQDPRRLHGKMLRIIPAYNKGGRRYRVPSDNPFSNPFATPDDRSPVWALGLRHPQNLCFDTGGSGALIFTDIGQANIEEVNILRRGANYGWPVREGTFVTDTANLGMLYKRGSNDAQRGFTYPVAQYDHSDGRAITGGFVCRGAGIPALEGHYLCGDMANGRIFHVPVADLLAAEASGNLATLRELTLLHSGRPTTMAELADAGGRVDLRFGQGQDGTIYVMSKQDGRIRKLAAPAVA